MELWNNGNITTFKTRMGSNSSEEVPLVQYFFHVKQK